MVVKGGAKADHVGGSTGRFVAVEIVPSAAFPGLRLDPAGPASAAGRGAALRRGWRPQGRVANVRRRADRHQKAGGDWLVDNVEVLGWGYVPHLRRN